MTDAIFDTPPDIAMLGGGPIGLATAILLARHGFAPVVYDARPLQAALGDRRLLALSRGSWQVLQPLLGEQRPRTAPILDVHVSSAGEFGATHLQARDIDARAGGASEPLGVTVYYGDLLSALAAAAQAEPGLRLQRPVQVTRVSQRIDAVDLELSGVDNVRSVSSAALAIHAEGSPPGPGGATATPVRDWALIGDVQLSGPAPGSAYERFTRDGPLALLPAPSTEGPRWSLVWCMDETAVQRRGALGDAAFRAELQQAVGPRIARIEACAPRRAVPLPQQARAGIADHRVVWIGNAAQTLHPVAGQGLNLGLRDALTLVDCLVTSRNDFPNALAQYRRRRSADRALVRGVTRLMPPLFASRAVPVALARSLGLTAMDLLPPLRRQWARLLMFGLRD
jgi:2-octaprenyl-6-methoxyphenol hydroxylase